MDYILSRLESDALGAELNQIEIRVLSIQNQAEKAYWLARIAYQRAEFAERDKDEAKAEALFDKSQDLVEESLELAETSDAFRLLGDTYMRLMNYKGLLYQMANGMSMGKYSQKALDLDSTNVKAYTSKALLKIYSPAFAGGDIDKGLELLDYVIANGTESESYMGYYFKAVAYSRQEDYASALNSVRLGMERFPSEKGSLISLEKEIKAEQLTALAEE